MQAAARRGVVCHVPRWSRGRRHPLPQPIQATQAEQRQHTCRNTGMKNINLFPCFFYIFIREYL